MKNSLKFATVAVLFLGLVVWNYTYKQAMDNHFSQYNFKTATIKDLKDSILSLNHNIAKSVLFQYYNNDFINEYVKQVEQNLALLEFDTQYFSETDKYKQKFTALFNSKQESIADLMILNAKIKNSMNFLSSQIYQLQNFDSEYVFDVMEIINYFFIVKNTLDYSHTTNIQLFENVLNYQFDEPDLARFHKLLIIHTNMLLTEFPHYIEAIDNSTLAKELVVIDQMLQAYIDESTDKRGSLDFQIFLIVFFSFICLAIILYLLLLSEREKQKIIQLQDDFNRSITTDMLTKLPNRTAYFATVAKDFKKMHFLLIDLIGFRNVNNIFGMQAGDYLLQEIAKLLHGFETKDSNCKLFRIGADEFALVYDDKSDQFIAQRAQEIVEVLENSSIYYKQIKIPININIGISSTSPHLLNAQLCVKELHASFGEKIRFYDPSMNPVEQIKENIEMVQKVKEALEQDQIVPYFQPIVSLSDEKTHRYEALVRMQKSDEVISPFFFLDISKKVKLYNAISHTMIEKSLEMVRKKGVDVAINISIEDIIESNRSQFIYNLLERNSDIAHRLVFEIVESEQITNYEQLLDFIKLVKPYGCMIAIDDFGSGYSNFDHLFNFDVDYLKIDGSLIKNIHKDRNSYMIVKTIVAFASEAKIKTVAEFVHCEDVHNTVKDLGFDYGQGYYYAKPGKDITLAKE